MTRRERGILVAAGGLMAAVGAAAIAGLYLAPSPLVQTPSSLRLAPAYSQIEGHRVTEVSASLGARSQVFAELSAEEQEDYLALLNAPEFCEFPSHRPDANQRSLLAFQRILASPRGVAIFDEVFELGTPEARVYGLCGLALLDRAMYERRAEDFLETPDARFLHSGGCEVYDRSYREIFPRIERGELPVLLAHSPPPPPPPPPAPDAYWEGASEEEATHRLVVHVGPPGREGAIAFELSLRLHDPDDPSFRSEPSACLSADSFEPRSYFNGCVFLGETSGERGTLSLDLSWGGGGQSLDCKESVALPLDRPFRTTLHCGATVETELQRRPPPPEGMAR